MKRYLGKTKIIVLLLSIVLCAVLLISSVTPVFAAGQGTGINTLPLGRDKATAPYAVFQEWRSDKRCFDDSDNTLKTSATYANCAVRFSQHTVTGLWWLTIPSDLPTGTYIVICRDGTDGSETNADTDIVSVVITWNKSDQTLSTTQMDVLASY